MNSIKTLKKAFVGSYKGSSANFSTYNNYKTQSRISSKAITLSLLTGFGGYLYFQETYLSTAITEIQNKYYNYCTLVKHNREEYEKAQYRDTLSKFFDPEGRMEFIKERISRQLETSRPFEGDFLSTFVDEKGQEIKDNGAQIYFAQRGGGKSFEALKIAKEWKKGGDPVLFFDKTNYVSNSETSVQEIFRTCGIQQPNILKEVLIENTNNTTTTTQQKFDIIDSLNKIFMFGHQDKETTQENPTSKSKKQLLVVIDDADELYSQNGKGANNAFLLRLKELVKDDLVKVLFLCSEWETKNKIQEEFDAGLWRGISKGSMALRTRPVVIDYISYISDVTGLKGGEAEKFFFFFGVDYATLRDLKRYLQWYAETHKTSKTHNIDDFIELKVKECAELFREKQLDKPLIRICRQLKDEQVDSKLENVLTTEDRIKLAPVLGPDGWVSFKYAAAAYSLSGKPWQNLKMKKMI